MKRSVFAAIILGMTFSAALAMLNYSDTDALKHDTDRWAVIEDVNGDRMAVEPTSDSVWSELVHINREGKEMFVGGIVERYGNKWGFRFRPDTVTVAEFTAEGLQGTIAFISSDIGYWEKLGWTYVSSKVVEVHS
ncbi:MAG: hypothetical protein ABH852_04955 [Methanobacteriota archaeon]